jgi:hypothetical protein
VRSTGCCFSSHQPAIQNIPIVGTTHVLAQRLQPLGVHVLPDALHVVPVRHDAVRERVADLEQAAGLALRARADEDVALERARHGAHVLGPPDVGGEEALGHVLAGEAGARGAAAVVEDDGRIGEAGVYGHGCGGGMGGRGEQGERGARRAAGGGSGDCCLWLEDGPRAMEQLVRAWWGRSGVVVGAWNEWREEHFRRVWASKS